MNELINNIFLTSLLVSVLIVGYIRFRDDPSNYVGNAEKYTVVALLLFSFAVCIISALAVIWI